MNNRTALFVGAGGVGCVVLMLAAAPIGGPISGGNTGSVVVITTNGITSQVATNISKYVAYNWQDNVDAQLHSVSNLLSASWGTPATAYIEGTHGAGALAEGNITWDRFGTFNAVQLKTGSEVLGNTLGTSGTSSWLDGVNDSPPAIFITGENGGGITNFMGFIRTAEMEVDSTLNVGIGGGGFINIRDASGVVNSIKMDGGAGTIASVDNIYSTNSVQWNAITNGDGTTITPNTFLWFTNPVTGGVFKFAAEAQ